MSRLQLTLFRETRYTGDSVDNTMAITKASTGTPTAKNAISSHLKK